MNIFKVLASGKKSFPEESASAVLAWLLNPQMDHGVGYEFLRKFLAGMAESLARESPASTGLRSLVDEKLGLALRASAVAPADIRIELEKDVKSVHGSAFIDLVMYIDNFCFSIENKIYPTSAQDREQLLKQYEGIKEAHSQDRSIEHTVVIFLVPRRTEEDDLRVTAEYDGLSLTSTPGPQDSDFKAMVFWQENPAPDSPDDSVSIAGILKELLAEDQAGDIDPIPESTKHIMRSLTSFIADGFTGYKYATATKKGGENEKTKGRLTLRELKEKASSADDIYVGVSGGIPGLMKCEDIGTRAFQWTDEDMSREKNWMPLQSFLEIGTWVNGGVTPREFKWTVKLPAETLLKVADAFGDKVYIGIQGGIQALRNMPAQQCDSKSWVVSSEKKSSQWIPGREFAKVVRGKCIACEGEGT